MKERYYDDDDEMDDEVDSTKYSFVGVDGNAFSVMGYVQDALKSEGLEKLVPEYLEKAKSSDYNHLLCVSMDYVEKANSAAGCNS